MSKTREATIKAIENNVYCDNTPDLLPGMPPSVDGTEAAADALMQTAGLRMQERLEDYDPATHELAVVDRSQTYMLGDKALVVLVDDERDWTEVEHPTVILAQRVLVGMVQGVPVYLDPTAPDGVLRLVSANGASVAITVTNAVPRCRVCGCTDDHACIDPVSGQRCWWVEPDLCSACAGKQNAEDQERERDAQEIRAHEMGSDR